MSSSGNHDNHVFTYMDGIPVKISERYKPPKKISLPGSVLNRPSAVTQQYNFSLERSMAEKMGQWRELRRAKLESRQLHLDAETANHLTQPPVSQSDPISVLSNTTLPLPQQQLSYTRQSETGNQLNEPQLAQRFINAAPLGTANYPVSSQEQFLTPVQISLPVLPAAPEVQSLAVYPFNLSDFEADTSSPFDNMELKTLNDLEELAHVLGNSRCCDESAVAETKHSQVARVNGYTHPGLSDSWSHSCDHSSRSHKALYSSGNLPATQAAYVVQRVDATIPVSSQPPPTTSPSSEHNTTGSRSVPDILQELQTQLHDRRATGSKTSLFESQHSQHNPIERWKQTSSLASPLAQLSPSCQALAKRVAEMGFPLARAARAAQLFGDDQQRVIEFLLQVQDLEERGGHPGDRAERALVAHGYDEIRAAVWLDNVRQLTSLGFREERVMQALANSLNDRDKALDSLVA